MKYGMNLLLWTGELNESLLPTLEKLKAMGYDGVEIPVFNLDLDYAAWGKRFDKISDWNEPASRFELLTIIRSVPMPPFAKKVSMATRKRSTAAPLLGCKPLSGLFIPPSATSVVRVAPKTNGIGASTACVPLPNMQEK